MHNKVESEQICNMQIMQELPANKLNFAFKHPVDLYNINHIAKYLSKLHIMPHYNMFQKNAKRASENFNSHTFQHNYFNTISQHFFKMVEGGKHVSFSSI